MLPRINKILNCDQLEAVLQILFQSRPVKIIRIIAATGRSQVTWIHIENVLNQRRMASFLSFDDLIKNFWEWLLMLEMFALAAWEIDRLRECVWNLVCIGDLVLSKDSNNSGVVMEKNITKEKLEVFKGHYNPNPFQKIGISSMTEVQFVPINEIIRLEADDNMTHFWIKDGRRITASKTLKHFDKLLAPFNFFKVHQSHLVNLNYIKTYIRNDGGYLIMEDGKKVDISRRRRPFFLERLRQLQDNFVV